MTDRFFINSSSKTQGVTTQQLWFTEPYKVEVREYLLVPLAQDEALVQVEFSSVSAGTELLLYRGQIPSEMKLDASLTSLRDNAGYPLQYGYASVGRVVQVGTELSADWLNKRVFAFQPHASHFIAKSAELIVIPEDISSEAAVFLPNMETAVNLIQDGNPGLGERVAVLGQGIVGLLLSALLARFPLAQLNAVESIPLRRNSALQVGVQHAFDPNNKADLNALKQLLNSTATNGGADLIYEVSGAPEALNLAIELSGFASRIVIGSWYGNKTATIALGGNAHRNRLKISTSQVSSLSPELTGRWNKARRFELAWEMLRHLNPAQLITHRVPIADAQNLYQSLHESADSILQAVFYYTENN